MMTDTRPGAGVCTLWGGALSLYTGKVRSYLIKKGVPTASSMPRIPTSRPASGRWSAWG
jgi:hypothetical protein